MRAADREFFRLVADTVCANPFSDERRRLDARIAGAPTNAPWSEVVPRVTAILDERLAKLGPIDIGKEGPDDREALELGIMFSLFHAHASQLDAVILSELAHGGRTQRVPIARDFIGALVAYGISRADALRYFAMAFQFRRAFYFIERSLPGESPSMRRLRASLWNNVFTHDVRLYARHMWRKMEDFSTFVLGETGAGKGTAAAAIGRSCFIPFDDKREMFVESFVDAFSTVNLSQFAASLLESELFGHKKGAFTGAVEDHVGALGRCSPHGAIFLDEIGEIDVPVQIKLLHVLQDRRYAPVGSHQSMRFSGRVIAATNQSLDTLREEGRFRDDFYYRLCSDVIVLPTLRERVAEDPEELDVLLAFIVRRILGEDVPAIGALVRETIARDLGADYPWPGNVRELEQCVRRVILTRGYLGDSRRGLAAGATETVDELLVAHCRKLYKQYGTYGEVARKLQLDWRTVKKYVTRASGARNSGIS